MSAVAALVLCLSPTVMDGDTFRCANIPQKIRIAGIDAPDKSCNGRRQTNCLLTGPRGDWTVSRDKLARLFRTNQPIMLRLYRGTTYGRSIAAVCIGRTNVGAFMVRNRYARYMAQWNGAGVRYKCQG